MNLPGVYRTTLKNGTVSYRASMTHRKKHISLGSFPAETAAHEAYLFARKILEDDSVGLLDYYEGSPLSFEKWVVLINLRDNGIYFSTPVYLMKTYFIYYLDPESELKFDLDDLFYYSSHKIMRRGKHLFVSDYGMQITLPSRYGIKSYGVEGKDFLFVNGDALDFRYENIRILNNYHGVCFIRKREKKKYRARIHVKSYYLIGYYETALEAAVAYNKAADIIREKNPGKNYMLNYINELNDGEYAAFYDKIKIADKIYTLE